MNVQEFYDGILELTGRLDRKKHGGGNPSDRQLVLLDKFLSALGADVAAAPDRNIPRLGLLNSALTTIGIKSISLAFFKVILGDVDFRSEESFRSAVERFCKVAMLEFGNFRYAYKILRVAKEDSLRRLWRKHYPAPNVMTERTAFLASRIPISGLIPIEPERLFALGYLAAEQVRQVNVARDKFKQLLAKLEPLLAADGGVSIVQKLKKLGILSEWQELLGKVNSRDATQFTAGALFVGGESQADAGAKLREKLIAYDPALIEKTQKEGRQNTDAYLAAPETDLYIATSMRELSHFTSMASFVRGLMGDAELRELKVRYFDPTLSHVDDRIQKGLVECMMVKRAKLTIYNAQEGDTFGKDSEASISLALGKPVIVYVARFLATQLAMEYAVIDKYREVEVADFVIKLVADGALAEKAKLELIRPGITKPAVVAYWAREKVRPLLAAITPEALLTECQDLGYMPDQKECFSDPEKLRDYVLERITRHESRALQFSDSHPLALQTALNTGVAHGVMVTRDIRTTAQLTGRILLSCMEYDMDRGSPHNTLLRERLTRSPVRVVANDDVLTNAFWDSYLSKLSDHELEVI
jgi:hypothetical protein